MMSPGLRTRLEHFEQLRQIDCFEGGRAFLVPLTDAPQTSVQIPAIPINSAPCAESAVSAHCSIVDSLRNSTNLQFSPAKPLFNCVATWLDLGSCQADQPRPPGARVCRADGFAQPRSSSLPGRWKPSVPFPLDITELQRSPSARLAAALDLSPSRATALCGEQSRC